MLAELTVYACLTCGTPVDRLVNLRWHESKGHLTEILRLKRRTRGRTETQWSTDWRNHVDD